MKVDLKRKPKVYNDDPILDKLIDNVGKIGDIDIIEYGNYRFNLFNLKIHTWWWSRAHIEVEGIELTVNEKKGKIFFDLVQGFWKTQHMNEIERKREKIAKALKLKY